MREHASASFKSTEVNVVDGKTTITGEMTLLGKTQTISFPADVKIEGGKVQLNSSFDIDRTQFGMNYQVETIEKAVAMTITIEA